MTFKNTDNKLAEGDFQSTDKSVKAMSKVVGPIRDAMSNMDKSKFDGTININIQQKSVPQELFTLLH